MPAQGHDLARVVSQSIRSRTSLQIAGQRAAPALPDLPHRRRPIIDFLSRIPFVGFLDQVGPCGKRRSDDEKLAVAPQRDCVRGDVLHGPIFKRAALFQNHACLCLRTGIENRTEMVRCPNNPAQPRRSRDMAPRGIHRRWSAPGREKWPRENVRNPRRHNVRRRRQF